MEDLKKFTWINCICCSKQIKMIPLDKKETIIDDKFFEEMAQMHPKKEYHPESMMWNSGIIVQGYAGYGSGHDGDSYYIGVCDECVTDNLNNGNIRCYENYMGEFDKEQSDRWEKMRNRSKNLDDLTK